MTDLVKTSDQRGDEYVNVRELHIDLDRSFEYPHHDTVMEALSYVRGCETTWKFTITLWINGWPVVRHTFSAEFSERDMEDEERMAEKIFEQLKYRRMPEVWDARYQIIGDKWEAKIKFSPAAKEAIEFLANHKQRLIAIFAPQLH